MIWFLFVMWWISLWLFNKCMATLSRELQKTNDQLGNVRWYLDQLAGSPDVKHRADLLTQFGIRTGQDAGKAL